jgi:tRNA uridine 5-carboxymethylaminomethyl modification enzyme
MTYDALESWPDCEGQVVPRETLRAEAGRQMADQVIEQIEVATRYAGYVEKQQAEVDRSAKAATTRIPPDFGFDSVRGLSFEARQVLSRARPETVGAASRLPGMTPAAIALLLVHVKRHCRAESSAGETSTAAA